MKLTKFRTLIILLFLLLVTTNAESKHFFLMRAGAGISMPYETFRLPVTPGMSFRAGALIGLESKRIRLGLGAEILNTSYTSKGDMFRPQYSNPTSGYPQSIDYSEYYTQVLIPVSISFKLLNNRKVSLAPEINFAPAFKVSEIYKRTYYPMNEAFRSKNTPNTFDDIALYGQAGINIIYNLTDNVGISFTPMYSHEIIGEINGFYATGQGLLAITCNVGVLFQF